MAETWAQLGPTLTGRPQGVCRGQGERFSSRSLKSARSRRTIALPAVAVEALGRHHVRQLEARLAGRGRWPDRGLPAGACNATPRG
jgi:hypothetical protein